MSEVTDVDIVNGLPTGGTGTVPTLSKTNTILESAIVQTGSEASPAAEVVTVFPVMRGTYVDHSIASATGSSQPLLAANTARKGLVIRNPVNGTADWTIDITGATAVAATPPGIVLSPGDALILPIVPINAITGIATAGAKLIVLEA